MTATASPLNHELPSLKEELTRKSLETLERLLLQYRQGKLTMAMLDVGLDTLFSAVNGLVDREFLDLITLATKEKTEFDASFIERRLFIDAAETSLTLVQREVGGDTLKVVKFKLAGPSAFTSRNYAEDVIPSATTKAKLDKMLVALDNGGYEELK